MSDFFDPFLYDLKIGPSPRVSELYLREAKSGTSPILELGCGTGDVLLPLAEEGFSVVGLDSSDAMLGRCRQRLSLMPEPVRMRVELEEARMETFSLRRSFNQIFIPNDTIAILLDEISLKSTLENCFSHLDGGGKLILDVSPFDVEYLGRFVGNEREMLRDRGCFPIDGGSAIQVWELTSYDNVTGILSAVFRYEFLDQDDTITRTYYRRLNLCPRRATELTLALEIAGFVNVEVESLDDETMPGLILRAAKAG
jgi:SAM-dependent methyltransferase